MWYKDFSSYQQSQIPSLVKAFPAADLWSPRAADGAALVDVCSEVLCSRYGSDVPCRVPQQLQCDCGLSTSQ